MKNKNQISYANSQVSPQLGDWHAKAFRVCAPVIAFFSAFGFGTFRCEANLLTPICFKKQSSTLPGTPKHTWLTKAVTDMDGDGYDDIVRLSIDGTVALLRQQTAGVWGLYTLPSLSVPPLSVVLADVTNDGKPDIFTSGVEYTPSGEFSYIKHYQSSGALGSYNVHQLVDSGVGFFIQAANAVDIDRDGYLDYFACNDIGLSRIWRGSPKGFIAANTLINMTTSPVSDNSGNYGSVWSDVNGDGRMDLYLAKCSSYAPSDPTDPRRVNTLFISGANGTFTEEADARGLADGSQSWCADFADIDNDGDMDCFIANHYGPSKLLLNQGGNYTDITTSGGITATAGPLQCIFRDFDNDGFVDLFVAGVEHKLFRNNGNLTFSAVTDPFPETVDPIRSFAAGDLNHDGFVDLYASTYQGESIPVADAVWLNDHSENTNHFLSIRLFGKTGNVNAVGARVKVMDSTGRTQVREVRAGESYGISNSLTLSFGLGSATTVTSAEVLWPDGATQIMSSLAVNQWHEIVQPRTDIPSIIVGSLSSNSIVVAANTLTPLKSYSLQSSTDLTQWTTLQSFTPLGTEHQFSVPINPLANRKQFFRLLWNQ